MSNNVRQRPSAGGKNELGSAAALGGSFRVIRSRDVIGPVLQPVSEASRSNPSFPKEKKFKKKTPLN
jgi:hypothetical protein